MTPVSAVVDVPGSKSIANRALVCAALADGPSRIVNLPDGDDTMAMVDGLGRIGHRLTLDRSGRSVTVEPAATIDRHPVRIDARLAGTTSRFLTAVGALAGRVVTVDGDAVLARRPMTALHEALRTLGAVVTTGADGGLPVTVDGSAMRGGTVSVPGDISSQFVTALMLIAPRLSGGLVIEISSTLVSRPYVELTAAVMRTFGAEADIGDRRISVPPARYHGANHSIEPDASSASYPWAAAAITGGSVTVRGLWRAALQGDIRVLDVLVAMGCTVEDGEYGTTVAGPGRLRGIDLDMSAISDLVPTVAAVALFADSPTTIRGVGFIRAKESDRLGDLAAELHTLGANVLATDDGLHIVPGALHGGQLGVHHDHRLAMAFGVIGLRVPGVDVDDRAVVSKSWPGFWSMLGSLS